MADPIYLQVTQPSCPAGTAIAAYTTTPAGISTALLHRVEVRIPAGHQGYTGIALLDSGHCIVPFDAEALSWLVGDNDRLSFDYGREVGSNVVLATYNTGTYVHAWQVRLIYTPMSAHGVSGAYVEVPARRRQRRAS